MKRIAIVSIAVVVVLAGGYTGASALAGQAIRTRLKAQTDAVTRLLPSVSLDEKYVSGPFSTTRTVRVHMGCGPNPKATTGRVPLTVIWRDRIVHGPLPGARRMAAAVIDSEVLAVEAPDKSTAGAEKPLLTAHTIIGFDGAFESDLAMDGATIDADGEKVSWTGLKARTTGRLPEKAGTLSYDFASMPMSADFDGKGGKGKLEIGAFHMTGSFPFDPNAPGIIVPGSQVMELNHLKVSAAAGTGKPMLFGLGKWTAKRDATLDKALWSSTTTMSGALDMGGFSLPKLEAAGTMRRIHAPSFESALRKVLALTLSCDATQNVDDPLRLIGLLQNDFFTMLTHDPEYAIGPIAIELAGKRGELSYRLGTRGVTAADSSVPLPILLQTKGVAHAEARAQLGLIDELVRVVIRLSAKDGTDAARLEVDTVQALGATHAMIDDFVKQGYLVREGDSVHASFESERGQFMLNGKPFALPAMGGAVAAPGQPSGTDDPSE